ncbi:MAG: tetratricopeptide repeat protein [Candidatus Methylomirabilales bacterium]
MHALRLAVLGLLLLAGCATLEEVPNEESAQRHYDIGVGALTSNDTGRAIEELRLAVAQAPGNARYQYALGHAYLVARQPDRAVEALRRAVELDPRYSDAYNALGSAYYTQKKWDLAIDAFRKALANPRYMKAEHAHLNLGQVYHEQRRYDLAAEEFRRVIDIVPKSPDGYFFLGRALLAAGKPAEAKEQLAKAVKLDESIAQFHLELGLAHLRLGEKAEAAARFRRVIELNPVGPNADQARRHLRD